MTSICPLFYGDGNIHPARLYVALRQIENTKGEMVTGRDGALPVPSEGQVVVGSISETEKCCSYLSSLSSLFFLFHPAEALDGPEFPWSQDVARPR